MQREQIIELVFIAVEMSQSISIGLFLLIASLKRQKSLSLLGLFLFVFGITKIIDVFDVVGSNQYLPFVNALSNLTLFLTPTLLYIYVHSLLIVSNNRFRNIILLTASLFVLLGVLFCCLQNNELFLMIYELIGILYLIFIFSLIIIQIVRHNKKLRNQYSDTKSRELNWILYLTSFFFFFFFVISFIIGIFSLNILFESLLVSSFSLIWLIGLAYIGLFYQTPKDLWLDYPSRTNITSNSKKDSIDTNLQNELLDSSKKTKQDESNEALFDKIQEQVIEKQLFLLSDLTVSDLAQNILAHPKTVSGIINEYAGCNFNSYINNFRVSYAKKLLINPDKENISIDGIGKMAGFRSNSAFYSSFKKTQGITPLQFQKNHFS